MNNVMAKKMKKEADKIVDNYYDENGKLKEIAEEDGEDKKPGKETKVEEDSTDGADSTDGTNDTENQTVTDNEEKSASETFEQQYKVLQGKYNAEVPKLANELKEAQQRNADLETLVSELSTKVNDIERIEKSKIESSEEEKIHNIGKKLNEDVSDGTYEAIVEIAKNIVRKEVAGITQEISGVKQDQVTTKQQRYINDLDKEIPQWKTVRNDINFANWLENSVPFLNRTFRELLTEAANKLDSKATVSIFKEYLKGVKEETPQNKKQELLEKHISPSSTKQTPEKDKSSGNIWSAQDIRALYKQAMDGKISQEDKKKYERQLFKAMKEGKIR